ncbi:NfeD family protein [Campylobacter suis]|uniref:NfeD family protein n=1 Tax=Campylobacter suis TaxID=2790657 RepID=A0ABN7K5K5_9BACT|nr:NfeD family protein [Campylobacter suis]CAD7287219.1 hypothetical protein LMG8286_00850 [Campylobacter suis]
MMINGYVLMAIGTVLGVAEIFAFGSFYLFFCGIGFFVTGVISVIFGDFAWYFGLLYSLTLAVVFAFLFRKRMLGLIKPKESFEAEFLTQSGIGEVRENMVYFKGTFWHFDPNLDLKNGDKVEILGTKGNEVIIKN